MSLPLLVTSDLRLALHWATLAHAHSPDARSVWRVLLHAPPGRTVSLSPMQAHAVYRAAVAAACENPPWPESGALKRLIRWYERTNSPWMQHRSSETSYRC